MSYQVNKGYYQHKKGIWDFNYVLFDLSCPQNIFKGEFYGQIVEASQHFSSLWVGIVYKVSGGDVSTKSLLFVKAW